MNVFCCSISCYIPSLHIWWASLIWTAPCKIIKWLTMPFHLICVRKMNKKNCYFLVSCLTLHPFFSTVKFLLVYNLFRRCANLFFFCLFHWINLCVGTGFSIPLPITRYHQLIRKLIFNNLFAWMQRSFVGGSCYLQW